MGVVGCQVGAGVVPVSVPLPGGSSNWGAVIPFREDSVGKKLVILRRKRTCREMIQGTVFLPDLTLKCGLERMESGLGQGSSTAL